MKDLEHYWVQKENKNSPPEILKNIQEIDYKFWKNILKIQINLNQ